MLATRAPNISGKTIRILSIDGGGIRGIIPAVVLDALIGDRRAADVFHVVAGTSTGGILACGLTKPTPLTPKDLLALYVEKGAAIFDRSLLERVPGHDLLAPRHSPDGLARELAAILGDTRLSQVEDVHLLVPSYCLRLPRQNARGDLRAPFFFRNSRAQGLGVTPPQGAADYDFALRDVARATSAAPTYFPPAQVVNATGDGFTLVDGGVFANDPTMCAIVDALRIYGTDHAFQIVSLGTGRVQKVLDIGGGGELGWAVPITSVMMDGSAGTVEAQVGELVPAGQYTRLDIGLTASPNGDTAGETLDDASPENIDALVRKGHTLVHGHAGDIARLRAALDGPRDAIPVIGAA